MPRIVGRREWLEERKALLDRERQLTKARDELAAARCGLPWVLVERSYQFETMAGPATLAGLFEGRSQLVVYHFMFGPDWTVGCKSCSFWADTLSGAVEHLRARDVTLAAISRAPLPVLTAFRSRMGWSFPWHSSAPCDFNFDFGVSFREPDRSAGTASYNFGLQNFRGEEAPGLSVFARGADGAVFHTYSTYARGLDPLNGAYQILDLVPRGRDEAALDWPMQWVRHRDDYR